jgi:hypothetical protein
MPRRDSSKRARLETYLAERGPGVIDDEVWDELQAWLAPVSSGYLRELLRSTGLPLSALVEGVRQDSLEEAERTLVALSGAYVSSGAEMRKRLRAAVIDSKDRLRWALKKAEMEHERRKVKEEILLWVLTWLENPIVFPAWLSIRKRANPTLETRAPP